MGEQKMAHVREGRKRQLRHNIIHMCQLWVKLKRKTTQADYFKTPNIEHMVKNISSRANKMRIRGELRNYISAKNQRDKTTIRRQLIQSGELETGKKTNLHIYKHQAKQMYKTDN